MFRPDNRHGLWIGLLLTLVTLAPAAPEEEPTRSPAEIAKEQIRVAKQAIEVLRALSRSGTISPVDPRHLNWSRRIVDAERERGASKAELIAAIEDYWQAAKALEKRARAQHEAGQLTHADLYDAQYHVLEAELLLAKAKAGK